MLAREVHYPGVGFLTLTRFKVTTDLQIARVYYTSFGDDKASARARKRSSGRRRSCGVSSASDSGSGGYPDFEFFYEADPSPA